MEECRKEFERRHRVSVRVVYGGSQCLLAQIAITYRNALIDIYAPGEEFYAKQAQDRGYVTIYKPMAYFIPVIMVREATQESARCKTWRSGRAASASAAGVRRGQDDAEDLLKKHGLTRQVQKNVVMHTAMAPELGNAVKLGSIDAAINWDAVAAGYEDGADIIPIPTEQNIPVKSSIGLLKNARQKRLARLFIDFVTGPEGRAIFQRNRYTIDLKAPAYPVKANR